MIFWGMDMRKALLALPIFAAIPITAASAADMAAKSAPAAPPPYQVYSWTGFYVGLEGGGGWANSQSTVVTSFSATANNPPGTVFPSNDYSGALGGFYGGYNYQFSPASGWGSWVVGIDGDWTWAGLTASDSVVAVLPPHDIAFRNDKIDWVATVTGRVGYAVDKWLFFGKGGWAWAQFSGSTTDQTFVGGTPVAFSTSQGTRDGWTAGGGLEYAVTPNIIFKLEGDYVKFNTANFNINETIFPNANNPALLHGFVGPFGRSATSDLTMFKGGVEYKF
jgi:outer membrane immunogenic protein